MFILKHQLSKSRGISPGSSFSVSLAAIAAAMQLLQSTNRQHENGRGDCIATLRCFPEQQLPPPLLEVKSNQC